MRIAVASEDGVTVSQHFGRAPYYVVLAVEAGQVVSTETRPKAGHHTFAAEEHHPPRQQQHGYGLAAGARHEQMAEVIADCDAVIAGGMGRGAYESMQTRGIRPIITDVLNLREAALKCAQGSLPNLMERLH